MKLTRIIASVAFLFFFLAGHAQEQTTSQKKKRTRHRQQTVQQNNQTTNTSSDVRTKAYYPGQPEFPSNTPGSSSDAKRNNNPCYPYPCEDQNGKERRS